MQPVGWRDTAADDAVAAGDDEPPLLAWIGRRALLDGRDISGLDDFIAAVRALRRPLRVRLVGERLDSVAAALRRAGIDCRALGLSQCPLARCAEWIARFDAVAITTRADSGPWPLFDAVRAGVPVVATPVGWASRLLGDGACGVLVDDVADLSSGIETVLDRRARGQSLRSAAEARVPAYGFDAWAQASLRLAAELAGTSRRAVA
jgi:glycosyltransferase involved in cell wall biosynthesis